MNKNRFISLILISILIPLGSYLFYLDKYEQVTLNTITDLRKVSNLKSFQIEDFIIKQKEEIKLLASDPQTTEAFQALNNANNIQPNMALDYFKQLQKKILYQNIFLVKPNGEIIFSTSKETTLTKGIVINEQNNIFLWKMIDATLTVLGITLSDFNYNINTKQFLAYFSVPVFQNDKLLGVMIIESNMVPIYQFLNDYKNLGETGEYVLADQNDENLLIKSPTRFNPKASQKKIKMGNLLADGLQQAVKGSIGEGKILDYSDKMVLAVWSYLPNAQMGFEVKITTEEVYHSLHRLRNILLIFNFAFLMVSIILIYFLIRKRYGNLLKSWFFLKKKWPLKRAFVLLGVCFGFLSVMLMAFYFKVENRDQNLMKKQAEIQISYSVEKINQVTNKMRLLVNNVVQDLSSGRLRKEDIELRLKRSLIEHPEIEGIVIAYEPYAYEKNIRLYAPSYFRNQEKNEFKSIDKTYDYTDLKSGPQTAWYLDALKSGFQWENPYQLSSENLEVISFSQVFYDPLKQNHETPMGVVAVFLNVKKLSNIVSTLNFEKNGYSFITNLEGVMIYHPIFEYVKQQKTVFQIASEKNEPVLRLFGSSILDKKMGDLRFQGDKDAVESHIYFQRMTDPNWVFAFNVVDEKPQEDVIEQQKILKFIIFTVLASCVCIIMALTNVFAGNANRMSIASILISSVLVVSIFLLWRVIYSEPVSALKDSTMVFDQMTVDGLIDETVADPKALNSLIKIPTGIYIRSFQANDLNFVKVNGYCWQKYPLGEEIPKTLFFPNASEQTFREIYRSSDQQSQMVIWDFSVNLWQPRKFWQFPFDVQIISLEIEPPDLRKELIFVPDFSAYQIINPNHSPGVDENVAKAQLIKKTYFSYQKQEHNVSLDISNMNAITDGIRLTYNMLIQRDVFGSFMLYLLPFLAILACIFMVLVTSSQLNPDGIISSYTVLLLGLVITHRELRNKLISDTIVYLEYFFIIGYFVLFLMMINTYIVSSKQGFSAIKYHHNILVKSLFWPLIFAVWFLITFIIFYQ